MSPARPAREWDAAVFDFDGVIIDSRPAVRIALGDALAAHGYGRPPDPELDACIGPPTGVALERLTGRSDVAAMAETYQRRYGEVFLEQTRLVDGIERVLREAPLPLALATAKEAEFTGALLESLGLTGCFAAVCAPAMSELAEPKSATVGHALDALGTRRAVMVGDTTFDVDAARANSIPAIGVTWGIGSRAELEAAGVRVIVERPAELTELLGRR